jgi:hypothetical protein
MFTYRSLVWVVVFGGELKQRRPGARRRAKECPLTRVLHVEEISELWSVVSGGAAPLHQPTIPGRPTVARVRDDGNGGGAGFGGRRPGRWFTGGIWCLCKAQDRARNGERCGQCEAWQRSRWLQPKPWRRRADLAHMTVPRRPEDTLPSQGAGAMFVDDRGQATTEPLLNPEPCYGGIRADEHALVIQTENLQTSVE